MDVRELKARATEALREKRFTDAFAAYEAAVALAPEDSVARFGLARMLLQVGQPEHARREFETLLRGGDGNGQWYSAYAVTLNKLGDRDNAIIAMRRAIEIDGDIGTRAQQLAAWEHAGASARSINTRDLITQAQAHRLQGNWSEALALVDCAISTKDDPPDIWLALQAECRERLQRPEHHSRRANGEASAAYYDAHYAKSEVYARAPDETSYLPAWTWVIDHMATERGARVLDLGCGPGQFAELLFRHRRDISYIGVDFSRTAINLGQERCPLGIYIAADVVRSNIIDRLLYDVVVATEFLEHIEDDREVLSRLASGSLFIGSVPNFDSLSHVRFFESEEKVRERYEPVLQSMTVAPIDTGRGRILFTFSGLIRPGRDGASPLP